MSIGKLSGVAGVRVGPTNSEAHTHRPRSGMESIIHIKARTMLHLHTHYTFICTPPSPKKFNIGLIYGPVHEGFAF
jgi:hypothetical protein